LTPAVVAGTLRSAGAVVGFRKTGLAAFHELRVRGTGINGAPSGNPPRQPAPAGATIPGGGLSSGSVSRWGRNGFFAAAPHAWHRHRWVDPGCPCPAPVARWGSAFKGPPPTGSLLTRLGGVSRRRRPVLPEWTTSGPLISDVHLGRLRPRPQRRPWPLGRAPSRRPPTPLVLLLTAAHVRVTPDPEVSACSWSGAPLPLRPSKASGYPLQRRRASPTKSLVFDFHHGSSSLSRRGRRMT